MRKKKLPPVSLSAAAELMKNKDERAKGFSSDSIVDDIIAELEFDRETRKRLPPITARSVESLRRASSRVSTASESDVIVGNGGSVLNYSHDRGIGDRNCESGQADEEVFTLNAKLTREEKDSAFIATAEWKAVRNGGDVGGCANDGCSLNSEEILDFDLDSDGSFPFYILDAYEELYGANAGNLYLFGKVKKRCCQRFISMIS